MILDQTIGSARAEKQNNPSARHVVRYLLTAMLASALAMPSLAVWGNDSPQTAVTTKPVELPLPPIPYLDSIPWMKWNAAAPMMKIDTLMAPSITPWGILQTPQDRAQARPTFS
jgi:hypothetical protein